MTVVDASVLLDIFADPAAAEAEIAILESTATVYAPHVIDLEVVNGLRKMLLSDRIDLDQASNALSLYRALPINRIDMSPFIDDVWSLRDNFTAYDAAYVALAMGLAVPLMTRDQKLASHAKRLVVVM
jgi:predicted nucleic acid-binding protein